ncbi:MAG: hypothetical protein KME46_08020 [Brasilonema angustatum HA4187-MV1]|nr:hypothetical protein [Brasilonema angustatum HA4187-MV1]
MAREKQKELKCMDFLSGSASNNLQDSLSAFNPSATFHFYFGTPQDIMSATKL